MDWLLALPHPTKVLVAGNHDWAFARVREVRPALHLFGHIHQDGGFWTDGGIAFANATTWECERAPTVVELDQRTREVRPVSVPPAGA